MIFSNHLYKLAIIVLLVVPVQSFKAKPTSQSQLQPQPNILNNIIHDIQDDLFRIEHILELKPQYLQQYGVVRVLDDNSVIVNAFLADLAMSSSYVPTLETIKMQQSKINEYVQVSFAGASKDIEATDWQPVGPCRNNTRSSSKSIYNQGWSLDIMSGVTSVVSFTAGIAFQWESDLSAGISGVVACEVELRKTLQFQMRTELWTMQGVETRSVTIKPGGFFSPSSILFGEWKSEECSTIVNYRRTDTACVTDPNMLQCDRWDEYEG